MNLLDHTALVSERTKDILTGKGVINLYFIPLTDNKNLKIIKSGLSIEVLINTSKVCLLKKLEQENYCIIYVLIYSWETHSLLCQLPKVSPYLTLLWHGVTKGIFQCVCSLFVTAFLCFPWSLSKPALTHWGLNDGTHTAKPSVDLLEFLS